MMKKTALLVLFQPIKGNIMLIKLYNEFIVNMEIDIKVLK